MIYLGCSHFSRIVAPIIAALVAVNSHPHTLLPMLIRPAEARGSPYCLVFRPHLFYEVAGALKAQQVDVLHRVGLLQ